MSRIPVPTTTASKERRRESEIRELNRRVATLANLVGSDQLLGGGSGTAGPAGAPGAAGTSVTSATVNGSGHLILTMSTGATIDAGVVTGATGAAGPTGPAGTPGMTGPLFTAVQTAAQTGLPSGAFTALAFPGEIEDSHNGHSTSTNNSRFTCPASWAGCYWVSGTAHIVGTGGKRGLAVFKNGVQVAGSLTMVAAAPTFDTAVSTGWTLRLVVGDYVELRAFHDAGVARDTYADPPTGYGSSINVEYRRA